MKHGILFGKKEYQLNLANHMFLVQDTHLDASLNVIMEMNL